MYSLLGIGSIFVLDGTHHRITAVESDENDVQQVFEYDFRHRVYAEDLYASLDGE